jgi:hypothetical protein
MHRGENRFHLIVGSLALAIGACAILTSSRRKEMSLSVGIGAPGTQVRDEGSGSEW